jgi:hypothetical protein
MAVYEKNTSYLPSLKGKNVGILYKGFDIGVYIFLIFDQGVIREK